MMIRRPIAIAALAVVAVAVLAGYAVAQTAEGDDAAWAQAEVVKVPCPKPPINADESGSTTEPICLATINGPPPDPEAPMHPTHRKLLCDALGADWADHVACNPPAPPDGAPQALRDSIEEYRALQGQ